MDETTLDKTAGHLLTLLILSHKPLFKNEHGVTGVQAAQYRLLGCLMKGGTLSMSVLGNRLYISKPYMTSLVDALIAEGYVERQPDLRDRRVINISITENGLKHLYEAHRMYKGSMKGLLSSLTTQDLDDLCTSAETVVSILAKVE
jgi:DNA-binding MarR family transcriptional regulator